MYRLMACLLPSPRTSVFLSLDGITPSSSGNRCRNFPASPSMSVLTALKAKSSIDVLSARTTVVSTSMRRRKTSSLRAPRRQPHQNASAATSLPIWLRCCRVHEIRLAQLEFLEDDLQLLPFDKLKAPLIDQGVEEIVIYRPAHLGRLALFCQGRRMTRSQAFSRLPATVRVTMISWRTVFPTSSSASRRKRLSPGWREAR